ncbi:hypothetical protein FGB62_44g14 [Gracilaria domingensis]|nr:hypothetical protein FGB62_44g14 [Gracilaria domingensis]
MVGDVSQAALVHASDGVDGGVPLLDLPLGAPVLAADRKQLDALFLRDFGHVQDEGAVDLAEPDGSAGEKAAPGVAGNLDDGLEEDLCLARLDGADDVADGVVVGLLIGGERAQRGHLGVDGDLDVIGAGGQQVGQGAMRVPLAVAPGVMASRERNALDLGGGSRTRQQAQAQAQQEEQQISAKHCGGGGGGGRKAGDGGRQQQQQSAGEEGRAGAGGASSCKSLL